MKIVSSETSWSATLSFSPLMCEHFVIGADPFAIERLWKTLYASGYTQHPDIHKLSAISAIEIACWDIVGKALGQPIYNLLGGQVPRQDQDLQLPLPGVGRRPAGQCRDALLAGSLPALGRASHSSWGTRRSSSIRCGTRSTCGPSALSRDELDNAEAVVARMREVIGSQAELLIGTHGQMTPAARDHAGQAARAVRAVLARGADPARERRRDGEGGARDHASRSPPASVCSTRYDYRPLLEKQAVSILQMALGRVGGILEAKKIAAMAEAHYVNFAPHLWAGPIEAAASLQIDVCCPNFLIQEGHRALGRLLRRDPGGAIRLGEGLHHAADRARASVSISTRGRCASTRYIPVKGREVTI